MAVIVPTSPASVEHDASAKGFKLVNDVLSPGINKVYGTDGAGVKGWKDDLIGLAYDSLTLGAVTADVRRISGSTTLLTTPGAGQYTLEIQSGAEFSGASIFGNNTVLTGASEFIIRVDNSANSRDRRVNLQLYDANTGALVDQFNTSTNHTQATSGNISLITLPGMNLFGATGFWVELS